MVSTAKRYFTQTILPCHARMYAAALAITGSREDASDVVQSAMMRIWEKVKNGWNPESPMAYCLKTVRNISISENAVRMKKTSFPLEMQAVPDDDSSEKRTDLLMVEEMMLRLSANERQAVEMSAYGGCSSEEIATALGVSSDNARKILSRGRKRLRSMFEKHSS